MKKRNQIILVSLIIIIVIITLIFLINNSELKQLICKDKNSDKEIIGGQRDAYGCLGPAGYTYDEEIQACIRIWELDEIQKKAAKIAVEHVRPSNSLTIIQVEVLKCKGCFSINLTNKNFEEININFKDWEVVDKKSTENIILTAEQCTSQQGRLVNIVADEICNENETNIGDVLDFISPNICCVEE